MHELAGEQQPGAEQREHGHVCVVMGTFFCSEGVLDRGQVHAGVEEEDEVLLEDPAGSQA